MQQAISICWLRRDLRLHDHRALFEACRAGPTVVVFAFDTTILSLLTDRADRRLQFIHASLAAINRDLHEHGSRLIIVRGDPVDEIPRLARELSAQSVYVNHDYEPSAIKRDQAVAQSLLHSSIAFYSFKDQVIFERQEVQSQSDTPFKIFTPYKNAWRRRLSEHKAELQAYEPNLSQLLPSSQLPTSLKSSSLEESPLSVLGFSPTSLWLEPGVEGARVRLADFLQKISDYRDARNFPSVEGTSGLSVHLRFGTLSIRECARAALRASGKATNPGAETWLDELIWRDFYMMILANFPHIAQGKAFKPETDAIEWPGSEAHFQAWCDGRTGFAIVDAAMRHFNATGWMHNRLRMIVASFLTKDLLVDWRKGEAYFARKLLDFDFAANNGGWQWSASTGCDAQPYFRIFNPITQSENFDPEGNFIRAQVPELAGVFGPDIHRPRNPIVDHAEQRAKALALFKR